MKFEVEVYADKIFVFKNVFNQEYIDSIIDFIDNGDNILQEQDCFDKSTPWYASNDGATYGIQKRSWAHKVESSSENIKKMYKDIFTVFDDCAKYYFDKLGMEFNPQYYTGLTMCRYDSGKEMGPHVDDDNDPHINPICTALIYLNSDKVGGDLYFKEQDVLVKTEAGTLVFFPCKEPFFHQSTLIESGIKYHITTGWKERIENV
jgi:hypothetical protein